LKVKYLDLPRQFKNKTLWKSLKEAFETCQFILGKEVEEFETKFAELCHTMYAIGLNSGTDAIFLSLKALGISEGDEVITVPNSFVATAGAIIAAGAKPVFVDVGQDYNINADLIEGAITRRTKAILPVHLTGNPADMPRILEIARKYSLFVLEDACQAVGASINGHPVGSFGDAGCFSLHPLKNLNVCGDGGVITTKSGETYEKIKLLRNHGLINREEIAYWGYNSRLDTLQAIVANFILTELPFITERRQRNAHIYDEELQDCSNCISIPPRKKGVKQVFHTYIIRVQKREGLISYLSRNDIETKIHYPIPIHLQKPCSKLGYKRGDFPECEKQAEEILSLPINQYLTEKQIRFVAKKIKTFYRLN